MFIEAGERVNEWRNMVLKFYQVSRSWILERRLVRVLLQSGVQPCGSTYQECEEAQCSIHLAFSYMYVLLVSYGLPQFACLSYTPLWCYWTFILYKVSEFESVWCFLRVRLRLCILPKIPYEWSCTQRPSYEGIWYQHHTSCDTDFNFLF